MPLTTTLARKRCLELLLTGDLVDAGTALDHANGRFAALCLTEDAGRGVAAFLRGNPLADEWPGS